MNAIAGSRRTCRTSWLTPSKFANKLNIIYTIYRAEMADVCRELNQTMLVRRRQNTWDTAAVGWITTAQGEELGPQMAQP